MPSTRKKPKHAPWLASALDYIPKWMAFQVERYKQPGATVAIAHGGELVAEFAFGYANLRTGQAMTPRHRLRIASHSKSFTAAGVMLLREQGKVGLDDPIGRHVGGLHKELAQARVGELLSHGGGVIRDGDDSGQFADRRPFFTREELRADLARKQPMEPGVQLKYSNHGYGLLGLMIEEITGTGYAQWMAKHVIQPAGLKETSPDMPHVPRSAKVALGHSMEFPFDQRLLIPCDQPLNGVAPAGGFVATAADVARFFSQLAPDSKQSILTPASRRDMAQRRWRDPVSNVEMHYGLGTMMGAPGPKEWFGHTGGLQGFVSRTARYTASGYTITVLTNAYDGLSWFWADGIESILEYFKAHGAPAKREAAWAGRWWNQGNAVDLVPMGKVVYIVAPAMWPPLDGATGQAVLTGKDKGQISRTSGFNSPGQGVRLVRDRKGKAVELWVGAGRMTSKEAMKAEMLGRYKPTRRKVSSRT
jgi:D-alanyl-D-alanine carboxypeptidase